jgi:hypothetical protein
MFPVSFLMIRLQIFMGYLMALFLDCHPAKLEEVRYAKYSRAIHLFRAIFYERTVR